MAKNFPTGERIFTDPRKAAAHVRKLMSQGGQFYGTRHAMSQLGVNPHHANAHMTDEEAQLVSDSTQEKSEAIGETAIEYAPTPSSNPADPRTASALYYPVTQRLLVEWGDGGPAYFYYNVSPQEFQGFQDTASPGRYINQVLNSHNYGRA